MAAIEARNVGRVVGDCSSAMRLSSRAGPRCCGGRTRSNGGTVPGTGPGTGQRMRARRAASAVPRLAPARGLEAAARRATAEGATTVFAIVYANRDRGRETGTAPRRSSRMRQAAATYPSGCRWRPPRIRERKARGDRRELRPRAGRSVWPGRQAVNGVHRVARLRSCSAGSSSTGRPSSRSRSASPARHQRPPARARWLRREATFTVSPMIVAGEALPSDVAGVSPRRC